MSFRAGSAARAARRSNARWACRRRWNGRSGSRRPSWNCPPKDVTEEGFGFGLEYVLLQRAALGCKIDGGQHKIGGYTHEDAEVIAATVAGMPDSLGGKRMAIRVAELARAGLTPDWMPGAVPRCVPVESSATSMATRQHHRRRHRARPGRAANGARRGALACPVTFSPHPQQIEAARRGYDDWWQALGWVRDGLIAGGMLREVEVTAAMPSAAFGGRSALDVMLRGEITDLIDLRAYLDAERGAW
jgi:hypothetical protein